MCMPCDLIFTLSNQKYFIRTCLNNIYHIALKRHIEGLLLKHCNSASIRREVEEYILDIWTLEYYAAVKVYKAELYVSNFDWSQM